jgi:hypothetical protein
LRKFLYLPLAEQGRWPDRAHSERFRCDHIDPNRFRKAFRLFNPRVSRTPRPFSR